MYIPTQIITIDGKQLEEKLIMRLLSWTYEDIEKVDKVVLTFDNEDLEITDNVAFQQGLVVGFRFGYVNELSDTKYFTINKISGFKIITLSCLEVITLFNTEQKTRVWEDSDLNTVVSDIATENNLKYKVEEWKDASGVVLKYDFFQPHVEDLAFLYTLAKHIGYEVWIEDDTIYFMPRKYWKTPEMNLQYDSDQGQILVFEPQTNSMNRGSFASGGIDLEKNQAFFFTENGETRTVTYLGGNMWSQEDMIKYYKTIKEASIIRVPCSTKEEAEIILAGAYREEMEDQITADLHLIGEPKLKSKTVIEVNGVKKYSGKYYVKSVNHVFDGSGYVSIGKLSRNSAFDDKEKYSKENISALVNKNRASKKEFYKLVEGSSLGNYYKRLLKL